MITRHNLPPNITYVTTTVSEPNHVVCVCGEKCVAPVLEITWIKVPIGHYYPPYQDIIGKFVEEHKDCK